MVEGINKSKTEILVVTINAPSQDNVKKQKFDTMSDCQNIPKLTNDINW